MHAGLVTGKRRFELVEVPRPAPAPGGVVVDVAFCGVCGSDVHAFVSGELFSPATCGHEWAGTISAVGAGVDAVSEGDRVVLAVPAPCGRCPECAAGRPETCHIVFTGVLGRDPLAPPHGGFAPQLAVDVQRVMSARAGLSDEEGALVEPTTIVVHALNRTPPQAGDRVVVQGCGPIGLLALQVARARGAGHVTAIDPLPHRRELAVALGADEALAPEEAAARFGTDGADLVVECAGIPATVQSAVALARRNGTVNLIGLPIGDATISPVDWLMKEVRVIASLGYLRHEFAEAMDLIADGHVDVRRIHDRTIGLDALPREMSTLAGDPTSAVKVLVDPRG